MLDSSPAHLGTNPAGSLIVKADGFPFHYKDRGRLGHLNLLYSGGNRFLLAKMRDTNLFKKIVSCPGFLINVN
jgi:hypothetical protein